MNHFQIRVDVNLKRNKTNSELRNAWNMSRPNDAFDHCVQDVVEVPCVPQYQYSFAKVPWKSIEVCVYSDQLCISWPLGSITQITPGWPLSWGHMCTHTFCCCCCCCFVCLFVCLIVLFCFVLFCSVLFCFFCLFVCLFFCFLFFVLFCFLFKFMKIHLSMWIPWPIMHIFTFGVKKRHQMTPASPLNPFLLGWHVSPYHDIILDKWYIHQSM